MTALEKYQRLEASGLWRAGSEDQRREVIVSIGDATLVISDLQDRALTHWSIPAIERANPGKRPAIYHPYGDPDESLELGENEDEMVMAIEKLRNAISKAQAKPGRLRAWIFTGTFLAVVAVGAFTVPKLLRTHVSNVVPELNRRVIGHDLIEHLKRVSGEVCSEESGDRALRALARRVDLPEVFVVPDGIKTTATLPGNIVVIGRTILEDNEDPAATSGYLLAEKLRHTELSGLSQLLEFGGFRASLQLITRGSISETILRDYAEHLARQTPAPVATDDLVRQFETYEIPASPYAYAVDISGETTIELIEADAFIVAGKPVLDDSAWVALQEICTN